MKHQVEKNINYKELIGLFFIIIGVLGLFIKLFYYQAISFDGRYQSDLPLHIELALSGEGYSILYYIISIIYRIFNDVFYIAVFEAIMVVATWLLATGVLCHFLETQKYIRCSGIALGLTIMTGIYVPCIYETFYKAQLITQPYHNITYLGMRLTSLGVMILFVKMYDNYLDKIRLKEWCLLTLLLVISTSIKPSFFYGFAFTLFLFLVSDLVKHRFDKKVFRQIFFIGSTVLPSLLVLFVQAQILYGTNIDGQSTGIALIWGKSFIASGLFKTVLKLLCGLSFPCLVSWVNRHKMDKNEKFIIIMFIIQLLVCILFTETGERANHGNFYWGLFNAAYLWFFSSIICFVKNIESKQTKRIYHGIGLVLLGAHLLSSVVYFIHIYRGGLYLV